MAQINIDQSWEYKKYHDQELSIVIQVKDEDADPEEEINNCNSTIIEQYFVSLKAEDMNFVSSALEEMTDKLCRSVGWRFEHQHDYMIGIRLGWEDDEWCYYKTTEFSSYYCSNNYSGSNWNSETKEFDRIHNSKRAIRDQIAPIVQKAIEKIEKYKERKQNKKDLTYPCNWE